MTPFHSTIPPKVHITHINHPSFYSTTSLQWLNILCDNFLFAAPPHLHHLVSIPFSIPCFDKPPKHNVGVCINKVDGHLGGANPVGVGFGLAHCPMGGSEKGFGAKGGSVKMKGGADEAPRYEGKHRMVAADGHHQQRVPHLQLNGVPPHLLCLPEGRPRMHLHLSLRRKAKEATQVTPQNVLIERVRGDVGVGELGPTHHACHNDIAWCHSAWSTPGEIKTPCLIFTPPGVEQQLLDSKDGLHRALCNFWTPNPRDRKHQPNTTHPGPPPV